MAGSRRRFYYPVSAQLHVTDLQDPVLICHISICCQIAAVIYLVEGEFSSRYGGL